MKVRFKKVELSGMPFTTPGYWSWDKPNNRGTLTILCGNLGSRRFEAAVFGHEIIESLYCWLFGVTTEQADLFDDFYEKEYAAGRIPLTAEPGHDPRCPYHWGHMMGVCWEYVCIYGTFASWKKYAEACDKFMGIVG